MSLRHELAGHFQNLKLLDLEKEFTSSACVAIILQGSQKENLQVGYIRRAHRELDRWSGQVAFPGGKRESQDLSGLATALRETQEEIGIELRTEECLGRLNDLQARRQGEMLEFFIRPFVFYVERELRPVPDPREVADFFWMDLRDLKDPERKTFYELQRGERRLSLPAIQLATEPPLWGLTYMMTQELLGAL